MILVNKDTIIQITPLQLKITNVIFERERYYHSLSLNLDTIIQIYKQREANYTTSICKYAEIEKSLRASIINFKQQKEITDKVNKIKLKQAKKKNIIIGGIGGVIIFLLILCK